MTFQENVTFSGNTFQTNNTVSRNSFTGDNIVSRNEFNSNVTTQFPGAGGALLNEDGVTPIMNEDNVQEILVEP